MCIAISRCNSSIKRKRAHGDLGFDITWTMIVDEVKSKNNIIIRGNIPFWLMDTKKIGFDIKVSPEKVLDEIFTTYINKDKKLTKGYNLHILNLMDVDSEDDNALIELEDKEYKKLVLQKKVNSFTMSKYSKLNYNFSLDKTLIPVFDNEIDKLYNDAHNVKSDTIFYFHCRHGKDRTGAFYSAYIRKYVLMDYHKKKPLSLMSLILMHTQVNNNIELMDDFRANNLNEYIKFLEIQEKLKPENFDKSDTDENVQVKLFPSRKHFLKPDDIEIPSDIDEHIQNKLPFEYKSAVNTRRRKIKK